MLQVHCFDSFWICYFSCTTKCTNAQRIERIELEHNVSGSFRDVGVDDTKFLHISIIIFTRCTGFENVWLFMYKCGAGTSFLFHFPTFREPFQGCLVECFWECENGKSINLWEGCSYQSGHSCTFSSNFMNVLNDCQLLSAKQCIINSAGFQSYRQKYSNCSFPVNDMPLRLYWSLLTRCGALDMSLRWQIQPCSVTRNRLHIIACIRQATMSVSDPANNLDVVFVYFYQ